MKKKVATVFGVIGYLAIIMAAVCLFRDKDHLFQVYAFLTIAALCSYAFLLYTQSKAGVMGALISHLLGLVALYFAGTCFIYQSPIFYCPLLH